MVKGLDVFRERFRQFEGSYVLIGGVACAEWFQSQKLEFRATKDLDIVLLVEVLTPDFLTAFRAFVDEGRYEIQERTEAPRALYRFNKPGNPAFPVMIELFSRSPEGLTLAPNQRAIPIRTDEAHHSLSALLMDADYYQLLQDHHFSADGLRIANVTSLIPLKAKAWLDLTSRKNSGQFVDTRDIQKHRSDVFRLAATLPGQPGPALPASILSDLTRFLEAFPVSSEEWPGITSALEAMGLRGLAPGGLRQAIVTFFRLA